MAKRRPYISSAERRLARQRREGIAGCIAVALAFAAMIAGAAYVDNARGIPPHASLAAEGL